MPRNGSGVYSKPAGTTAVPDTTIESAKYNSTIDDLVADANAARPITAGGTGSTSAGTARTALGVDPARTFVTKSAGYTALAADKAANIRFDGAYTLSLTAAATLGSGWYCYVQADGGAVTIDPNASETINGAATLTLSDGLSTLIWCDGSNFRAYEDYATKLDAVQNWVDVASATTTDIGVVASQNVRITGTTTITGLGTVAAGTFRRVRFADALTLTHNGTSLILPGAVNITTAAGDVGEFISEGSGNWRCTDYQRASGLAVSTTWNVLYKSSFTSQSSVSVVNGVASSRFLVVRGSVLLSSASGVALRLSVDGGASYIASTNAYTRNGSYVASGVTSGASDSSDYMFLNGGENVGTSHAFAFDFTIDNVTGLLVTINSRGGFRGSTSGNQISTNFMGQLGASVGPIGGIRLMTNTGANMTGWMIIEGAN